MHILWKDIEGPLIRTWDWRLKSIITKIFREMSCPNCCFDVVKYPSTIICHLKILANVSSILTPYTPPVYITCTIIIQFSLISGAFYVCRGRNDWSILILLHTTHMHYWMSCYSISCFVTGGKYGDVIPSPVYGQ
jgi:hypothetical protein